MAVPERINLFRAQALRSIGGNGWRMSHNSYRDTLYSVLDRVGILVWDETRDLRDFALPAFGQMVREHRNHPVRALTCALQANCIIQYDVSLSRTRLVRLLTCVHPSLQLVNHALELL